MNRDFYKKIESLVDPKKKPPVIESGQGAYLTINGRKTLNFCSSHYLGFAVEPRLRTAAKRAIDKYGMGTGYRTLVGTHILHVKLEKAIAHYKGAEAAIVLTGGYMANCAAIQTIIGKEDIVISDALNHASIIDAVRLSGVRNKFIYKHLDMNDLEAKLKEAGKLAKTPKSDGEKPLTLIVTDGVFSMDGDLAPLPAIVKLAKKYGALTMVDDAHGEGVVGRGRGIVSHFGISGQVDIEVGTLSKAFSVMGGFITGKRELIAFYKQRARQFLFSNALTIPDTAALLEAVTILQKSDALVAKLWKNTKLLKDELAAAGFDIGKSETPITPIMLGDEKIAFDFARELLKERVMASAIVFPMVAKGKARVRIIPSASHSARDIKFGIEKIKKVGKKLRVI